MNHISDYGLTLIESYEGFRANPYRDVVGVWTIGFGETRGVGPNTKPVTRAQATAALKSRIAKDYEPYIHRLGIPFNQNQFDALVSIIYNLGPGVLAADRSLGKALREKPLTNSHVAAAIRLYDKAGNPPRTIAGLTRRRTEEAQLFGKPDDRKATLVKLRKQLAAVRLAITNKKKREARIEAAIRRNGGKV